MFFRKTDGLVLVCTEMGLVEIIDLHGWHVSEQHHQRSSLIFNGKLRIVELILYNHEKLWPVKYSSQSFYENESTYLSCAYFEETPENKKVILPRNL